MTDYVLYHIVIYWSWLWGRNENGGCSLLQTTSPFQQQAKRSSRPSLSRRPAQRIAASAVAASAAIAGDGADVPAEKKGFLGIEAFTWQKIIPLGFMFFCILFNYTILRDTKVRKV